MFRAKFRRSEDGGFIIFSLFLFIAMLIVGGFAIDLARFEANRKHAQGALDNAVLAATNLQQSLDSEEVVMDFMEKSGYPRNHVIADVQEQTASNGADVLSRTLAAGVAVRTPTIFMEYLDVDNLDAVLSSVANETIQNVEISLVLDISGSMRFGPADYNSIAGLRDAVDDFINIVLDVTCDASGNNCVQSPDSRSTTINVIPYAGHVNVGPEMFQILGGQRWHGWSNCLEVADTDFLNADLPTDDLRQVPHFMRWSIDWPTMAWGWCPKNASGILYAENNAQKIKDYVRNIRLHDGTATHVGMKYGVALLNPSSRTAFQQLNAADDNLLADDYVNRPADFEDDVAKYLVVMTDGNTTGSFRPSDNGGADTFSYDDVYSLAQTNPDEYLAFFTSPFTAPTSATQEWLDIMDRYGSQRADASFRLTDTERDEVERGYPRASDFEDVNGVHHNSNTNNANLLEACDQAKLPVTRYDGSVENDRITIYSVAFNSGNAAANRMAACASQPNPPYFWNIADRNDRGAIGQAFRSIAYSINKLKLTQ